MAFKNPFGSMSTYASALRNLKQSATDWFHGKVKEFSDASFEKNPSFKKLEKRSEYVAQLQIGKMYMYHYDPKYKDTLPVYDKFPMVFPFGLTPTGFIGLNVHYLSGGARVALMNGLIIIYTLYPRRADRLSWQFLQNASVFPQSKECVHQYRWDHVRSPFLEIKHDDWLIASQLPVEQFVYK